MMTNNEPSIIWTPTFANIYLRGDGAGLSVANAIGGTVNCQYWTQEDHVGPNEKWMMRILPGGDINAPYLALESQLFPNCYVSMKGSGVTQQSPKGDVAKLHFLAQRPTNTTDNPSVIFVYRQQQTGDLRRFSLESVAFPGVYLAVNGTGMTQRSQTGGGSVYACWGMNDYSIVQALTVPN